MLQLVNMAFKNFSVCVSFSIQMRLKNVKAGRKGNLNIATEVKTKMDLNAEVRIMLDAFTLIQ